MAQVFVKYNPYKMETQISINGKAITTDSSLYKVIRGKRLQEWIAKFPQMLVAELNTVDFDIEFYGMPLDWDDFEDVFKREKENGTIKNLKMTFLEGKSDEAVSDKIVGVFTDLQEGPVDDFRDPKLLKAFANISNSVFPINVIATMSSGKSTLINALLGKKLMPSKNEACTATITEILDNDMEIFTAVAHDADDIVLQEIPELTYEVMNELNDDENVYRISATGNIPFLDANSTALMLVDTPGPNNSQKQEHKNTTYRAINSDANNLILYVLNGTQLRTNDDASLLSYVAEQIKRGGKQVRDRFLFVINKMDGFNPEEEDIEKVIKAAKRYLASYGIEDPQIFPCSAFTALNIRTYLDGIDTENMTRTEKKKLPLAARDTLPMIDKFNEYESMHLEQYSTLSPTAQRELNFKLSQAEKKGDTKEQALIHCGIYSIEAAIKAYVKKYAKTKKIKDLVESFQEVLESTQVLAKAKTQVATDEKAAKACAERAAAVKAKIADGKEAEAFKERIVALNPMPDIEEKAETLMMEATRKTSRVFEPYGDVITNRSEAKRLVAQFTMMSSDYIAELTSELESVINREVMETGERLLKEYQDKLSRIDENSSDKELNFNTIDLIRGALNTMKEKAKGWCSDDFATETVEDIGEVTYEKNVYYKKVGQKKEQVADGTERVKVGTKKVKVGSHKVKAGSHKVEKEPTGFLGKIARFFGKREYTYVDDFETVDDYKDEDVYETRIKYKTVMRDIYKEHVELIEKFSVETSVIQSGLVSKLRRNLDEGVEAALKYADTQIENVKIQFSELFDELDDIIRQKYTELERCATDQKTKEEELEKNRKLLSWIEANKNEIESILNI
ncbi:MAG: dynamin family protein [Ruminococcus sp.]|nr:dynamin family protein [Ruminococcus sp.]